MVAPGLANPRARRENASPGSKEGTPILLVEQNALMALGVAHCGYLLEVGTVALSDDAKALRQNERVRKTYLGEE